MSKVGKPRQYKSPVAMQKKMDEYFEYCAVNQIPLSITGLCLTLGLTRQGLNKYADREEFVATVEMAKLKIENAYEMRMIERGNAGDIFAMKNFGWTDKKEVEQNGIIKVEYTTEQQDWSE